MRAIAIFFLITAACSRVEGDILVDVDRLSLISVSDGSELSLTVNTSEFQNTIERLGGIFIVGVFDNSTNTYFNYTYPSLDGSQFPEFQSIGSGQAALRFQMREVPIRGGETRIFPDGLQNDSSSVCVGLHFADVGRVIRSKRICAEK